MQNLQPTDEETHMHFYALIHTHTHKHELKGHVHSCPPALLVSRAFLFTSKTCFHQSVRNRLTDICQ